MKYQLKTPVMGIALICLAPGAFTTWAQTSNVGSVSIAVLDPAGATVPGAQLQLRDTETNDVRKAETQGNGTYQRRFDWPQQCCRLVWISPVCLRTGLVQHRPVREQEHSDSRVSPLHIPGRISERDEPSDVYIQHEQ
jgi:hypothetical protein